MTVTTASFFFPPLLHEYCSGVLNYSLTLAKGERDRPGEDAIVSRMIIAALSEAGGMGREEAMRVLSARLLPSENVSVNTA